jgi:hypothetical protein
MESGSSGELKPGQPCVVWDDNVYHLRFFKEYSQTGVPLFVQVWGSKNGRGKSIQGIGCPVPWKNYQPIGIGEVYIWEE